MQAPSDPNTTPGCLVVIDTTTPRASVCVALLDGGEEPPVVVQPGPESRHGIALLPAVHEALAGRGRGWADISAVAVARGPGGFSGVRVGMSTAKALAQLAGARLVGLSSLEALALSPMDAPWPRCAVLDAKRTEVFAAVYADARGGVVVEPQAVLLEKWGEFARALPKGCVLVGQRLGELSPGALAPPPESFAVQHAQPAALMELARRALRRQEILDPLSAQPTYVRAPDIHPGKRQPPPQPAAQKLAKQLVEGQLAGKLASTPSH